jgi:hypothetical protein
MTNKKHYLEHYDYTVDGKIFMSTRSYFTNTNKEKISLVGDNIHDKLIYIFNNALELKDGLSVNVYFL